ncbi:sulfotransferase family protein [Mycobacterium sp. E2733]|uniref:sulfotransferase family protein n=1 Tax=Mycobacterium sp. E2733 TaxID=1834138 RepID=UPI000AEE82AE|nr:sulfotransferase family protein [Mycobacterium sp. E2733]
MRSDGRARPIESIGDSHESVSNVDVPGTGGRPVVLFVLGTQRSGTSAITRVLSLCGGTLPAGMLGADSGNPRGNWEPRKVIAINEAILHRYGSAWFDPSLRLLEDGALTPKQKAACVAEIAAYLNTLPAAPLLVIKDPRITTLSDLWFEASRLAGFDTAAVIAVRHPEEVISSVAASWGLAPELSSALWLKYNLLAERHTRGIPRVFVEYPNLLDDWRREIKRISMALPIDLATQDANAIEEFLTPDLRRQKNRGPVTNRFGTDWISALYDAQCMAARDERPDEDMLDRIFESYRSSEHDFRSAFEGYRKLSGGVRSRIFGPAVVKPMIEIVAMAHRRKGTWA